MNIEKKIIGNLEKCYCVAPLKYKGEDCFLVAAEKHDACYLFDFDGNKLETVWEGPGGVMSMVQVPGSDGQFLATHEFYSPNDSKNARIVVATPCAGSSAGCAATTGASADCEGSNGWKINTLVSLPFVHRFDILEKDGRKYLIACALKSGHDYKNDWSHPGRVYVAELPENLCDFNDENQLELTCIMEGLTKNHGYTRFDADGEVSAVISSENGIFRVYPPQEDGNWIIETLTTDSASDAAMIDLKGDGNYELAVLAPFHGPEIKIYEKHGGSYECVYRYDRPAEFTHAIWAGICAGRPVFIAGHREGARDLLAFTWDGKAQSYTYEIIDHDRGPANVLHLESCGREILVAANRETDEIALYRIKPAD